MARRSGGSRQWYCGRRRERVYTGASSRCGLALLGLEVVEDVGAHGSEHDMGKVFGVWDIVSVLDTASQFTNPELARGVGVVGVRATVCSIARIRMRLSRTKSNQGVENACSRSCAVPPGPRGGSPPGRRQPFHGCEASTRRGSGGNDVRGVRMVIEDSTDVDFTTFVDVHGQQLLRTAFLLVGGLTGPRTCCRRRWSRRTNIGGESGSRRQPMRTYANASRTQSSHGGVCG